jgi:sugar-specific transcriptional regulator TrmB
MPSTYKRLIDFGLSEKEARVYLALLELGPTTVQELASHSGVNRTTSYLAIESLKEHGLVTAYEEDKRSMLSAESPKRFADLIDDEVRIARHKQQIASDFIPELVALHRASRQKPVVRFFEGREGLRSFRAMLADTRTKQFETFARLNKDLEEIARTDEEDRLCIGRPFVRYRIVYAIDEGVNLPRFEDEDEDQEIRFIKSSPLDFDGEVGILDRMSYVASPSPRVQICVIESPQIAMLMRAQFEFVWEHASQKRVDFTVGK